MMSHGARIIARTSTRRLLSTAAEDPVKERLRQIIPGHRKEVKELRSKHGSFSLGNVTVDMAYGGMRGVKSLVYETSLLDAEEGIRFRGLTIPECRLKLTKADEPESEEPLPEALFYLLLTGEVPNTQVTRRISADWAKRQERLPIEVLQTLKTNKNLHPMTQLSIGIMALQGRSSFASKYKTGTMNKENMWEEAYEDVVDLIAMIPNLAATIYKNSYGLPQKNKETIVVNDWAGRFAGQIGLHSKESRELMRLYMSIHSDHEGGNVSAHAVHLIGSALSDPYLAFSGGLNGLAGPLHGLANQEVLQWLIKLQETIGSDPTEKAIESYIWSTLKAGQVVPGYGHAVLRKTDPRYTCQREFALKHLPHDPLFSLASKVYEVAPRVLTEHGKTKNPWPNVDAHSGVLLHHYGLTQQDFYTVLFAMSRAIGALSGLIWDRILALPIERPKSLTTDAIKKLVEP